MYLFQYFKHYSGILDVLKGGLVMRNISFGLGTIRRMFLNSVLGLVVFAEISLPLSASLVVENVIKRKVHFLSFHDLNLIKLFWHFKLGVPRLKPSVKTF